MCPRSFNSNVPAVLYFALGTATDSTPFAVLNHRSMDHVFCRLVQALITDKSGLTLKGKTANMGEIVVIHKPEFQLPLFTITFELTSQPRGAIGPANAGAFPYNLHAMYAAVMAPAPRAGRVGPQQRSRKASRRSAALAPAPLLPPPTSGSAAPDPLGNVPPGSCSVQ
jgi:hypothetical protein